MMYLDLGEIDRLFARRWLWSARGKAIAQFRREDYLPGESGPLDEAVRNIVERETGRRPTGPIRLLTHLRYYGIQFNPLSLFFCFDASGERVDFIVAEVSNTPWGERHAYVLDRERRQGSIGKLTEYEFAKDFHVSPFMPMDFVYRWQISEPGGELFLHAANEREGSKFFDATLSLARREITARSLASALIRYPFMTGKVIAAIYFEALRLWCKRTPFFPHPRTNSESMKVSEP